MKRVYKVFITDLPRATLEMNVSSAGFSSEVTDVIVLDKFSALLVVDIRGVYPYITEQWKVFIHED